MLVFVDEDDWPIYSSAEVRLAALHALNNSLEFVKDNFEREVSFILFRLFNQTDTWFFL